MPSEACSTRMRYLSSLSFWVAICRFQLLKDEDILVQLVGYEPVRVAEGVKARHLVVPDFAPSVGETVESREADHQVSVQHIVMLGCRLQVLGEYYHVARWLQHSQRQRQNFGQLAQEIRIAEVAQVLGARGEWGSGSVTRALLLFAALGSAHHIAVGRVGQHHVEPPPDHFGAVEQMPRICDYSCLERQMLLRRYSRVSVHVLSRKV